MGIIVWAIVGLIAGGLARLLVPGRDEMGIVATMILGLVGAFVGGGLAKLLFGNEGVGILGSTVGAIIVLLAYRAVAGRSGHRTV